MSDSEERISLSLELLRRKIRLGKFTRPCIFYSKHVILDIFQNVSEIWKAILLSYCLAELIDLFVFIKSIRETIKFVLFLFEWSLEVFRKYRN